MKKSINFNGDFEYELLDKNQPVVDLRNQLASLYSSPYADILWWELRDPSLIDHGYYKLFYYEQSVLKHIILFKYSAKAPKRILVINKCFHILVKDIDQIGRILFYEFEKLQQIIFERLYVPNPEQLPKIIVEMDWNDMIISLPDSMDTYMKSLGKKTRHHINQMKNHIVRDFPDIKVHYFEKSDILLDQIEKIISLNKDRMKATGHTSYLTDTDCKLLHQYASTSGFGFLCLCEIDNKIIGGTINSIIGESAYAHVNAHDNCYNKYSAGQINFIDTIKYLIEEKNIKYLHLFNGRQAYKSHLGAISYDRYTLRIFRNKDYYYFLVKIKDGLKNNYSKLKQKFEDHDYYKRFKNNKMIHGFYIKLQKIKIKILN